MKTALALLVFAVCVLGIVAYFQANALGLVLVGLARYPCGHTPRLYAAVLAANRFELRVSLIKIIVGVQ